MKQYDIETMGYIQTIVHIQCATNPKKKDHEFIAANVESGALEFDRVVTCSRYMIRNEDGEQIGAYTVNKDTGEVTFDHYVRTWILPQAQDIISRYAPGELTLRGLHYQLVSRGMTNSMIHYKRVVNAMIWARKNGYVTYETFSDHDRTTIGSTRYADTDVATEVDTAKDAIKTWMEAYYKNKWERQDNYVEVWIEKKALIGTFQNVTRNESVRLCPCKGYPSLTYLNEAADRFYEAIREGKEVVIIYFGDYDASGENIPETILDNFLECFNLEITLHRAALTEEQVLEMGLPPAPTKVTDSRAVNWSGIGQVELDAVDPHTLQEMCREAIAEYFDEDTYAELKEDEAEERKLYQAELKVFVNSLNDE